MVTDLLGCTATGSAIVDDPFPVELFVEGPAPIASDKKPSSPHRPAEVRVRSASPGTREPSTTRWLLRLIRQRPFPSW